MLSLKQIEEATDEDKEWGLDTWAKFFAAKTWKDIKMIAENNELTMHLMLEHANQALSQKELELSKKEQALIEKNQVLAEKE